MVGCQSIKAGGEAAVDCVVVYLKGETAVEYVAVGFGGEAAVDCVRSKRRKQDAVKRVVLQSVASSAREVVIGMGSTLWFEGYCFGCRKAADVR
jgi:hypothetical protein